MKIKYVLAEGKVHIAVLLLSDFEKAKEKCIKEIDDVINNVEIAMGENPVDEAYYDACVTMRKIVRKGFGVEK